MTANGCRHYHKLFVFHRRSIVTSVRCLCIVGVVVRNTHEHILHYTMGAHFKSIFLLALSPQLVHFMRVISISVHRAVCAHTHARAPKERNCRCRIQMHMLVPGIVVVTCETYISPRHQRLCTGILINSQRSIVCSLRSMAKLDALRRLRRKEQHARCRERGRQSETVHSFMRESGNICQVNEICYHRHTHMLEL